VGDLLSSFLQYEHLTGVADIAGVSPWLMIAAGGLMFIGWTGCYVAIIRRGFRDRAYGIPVLSTALNISWEFIFAFQVFGPLPAFYFPLKWGHRLWVCLDVFNVVQIFKYGKELQTSAWTRRYFYPITITTFIAAGPAIYLFMSYINDVDGVVTAMVMDLMMAVMFVGMFANRVNMRGLSLSAAWFRFVGDAASYVFCYFWWPAQFANGLLNNPEQIPAFENIPEPHSYLFLTTLYVVIPIVDLLYIYLLTMKLREMKGQAVTSTAGAHPRVAAEDATMTSRAASS
jgi:hypothetical protein